MQALERALLDSWLVVRNAGVPKYVPHLLKQEIRRFFLNRMICVEIEDGIRLRSHRTDFYLLRRDEQRVIEDFKNSIRPGAWVLDVGANVGSYTLLAAKRVGSTGRVIAVEPDADNRKLLEGNIRDNHYSELVEVIPFAASNRRQCKQFFRTSRCTENSLYPGSEVESIASVQCVPLDDLLEEQKVDIIKLDVEGHEIEALEGMEKTIARSEPLVMFVECNPSALARAGHTSTELLARLSAYQCMVAWAEVSFSHGSAVMSGQDFSELVTGTQPWHNSMLKCTRVRPANV